MNTATNCDVIRHNAKISIYHAALAKHGYCKLCDVFGSITVSKLENAADSAYRKQSSVIVASFLYEATAAFANHCGEDDICLFDSLSKV